MTNLYPQFLAALNRLLLFILLFSFMVPAAKSQRSSNPVRSSLKMAPNQALGKIGPELAALKTQRVARQNNATAPQPIAPRTNKSLLQVKGNYVVIEALSEN